MSSEMQQEVAIRVNNLSKCYQIYDKPNDRLKQFVVPPIQRLVGRQASQYFREFWALKDISFDIKKGETVGIIGRNGSGKSTLLQMICGTLHPTAGDIEVNGRVAALLELGSGFNPEFTGRENVYLNAGVLGLSNQQTQERFANIEAFADIGDFIDQPTKTYSSGMMVRLAFAVIAHVDADILVIDEALAVGDAVFTQKCMRFLRDFMEGGTVLFVSHDIGSVTNLCRQVVWLDHGVKRMYDTALEVTKAYAEYCTQQIYGDSVKLNAIRGESKSVQQSAGQIDHDTKIHFYENIVNSDGWKTGFAEVLSVLVMQADGVPVTALVGGERLLLRIEVVVHKTLLSPIVGFFVKDRLGQSLFGEHTYTYINPPCVVEGGEKIVTEFVFALPLLPNGEYSMTVSIADGKPDNHVQHHWLHDAVILHVQSTTLRYGLVGIPFEYVSMQKERIE